jgi:peptidoglycan/xylan/chitin deacetylase (PgdA/CDA1 family)
MVDRYSAAGQEGRKGTSPRGDIGLKVLVLFMVFALAAVAIYLIGRIPPRAVSASKASLTTARENMVLPVAQAPGKVKTLGLGYMVPSAARGRETARTAASIRSALRDAGLLRAYSEPPGRVVFDPAGGPHFLPVSPMPAGPRVPGAVSHGNRNKPRIALTFDDGYYGMGRLLDMLVQLRVPATLFPAGSACAQHADYIQRASRLGFEIANHSWTHPACTKTPTEIINRELTASSDKVAQECGRGMVAYFRPPYGDCDERVVRVSGNLGYLVVLWSRDTLDWSPATTPAQLIARATDGVANGDIILMHSQGPHTLECLPTIVKTLRDKGFELTTVSGVLAP